MRALNNLAMALSQVPGRASEGIELIDIAIKGAGRSPQLRAFVPELMDTKGVLLLKSNRLLEAKAVFEQALANNNEPRYQFHLILTLLEQNHVAEAKRQWSALDLEKLNPIGLTPAEIRQLKTLKQQFGS